MRPGTGASGLESLGISQVEEWVLIMHTIGVFDLRNMTAEVTMTRDPVGMEGSISQYVQGVADKVVTSYRVLLTFDDFIMRLRLMEHMSGGGWEDELLWVSTSFSRPSRAVDVAGDMLDWMENDGRRFL